MDLHVVNRMVMNTVKVLLLVPSLGSELFEKKNVLLPIKGPLKYLVAKLHGCYPNAISLPVSQNIFARFFRRRPVADSSRS